MRAKVAKQNASIFKMFNELPHPNRLRLKHLFCILFIINCDEKRWDAPEQCLGLKFKLCGGRCCELLSLKEWWVDSTENTLTCQEVEKSGLEPKQCLN